VKKVALIAVVAIGLVAFVGTDVIKSSVGSVREAVRDALTAEVPLTNQLAEAQAQVDAYAESIIRGEVAAENLRDMIGGVEREVRGLTVRVERERAALAQLRDGLSGGDGAVPVALKPTDASEHRGVLRRVRAFEASSELLERRTQDLGRLKEEYKTTLASLETARGEQVRLGEEIRVLAAELESLNARKAAARTRNAVGDSSVASSGFAKAHERIKKIRSTLREQNKLLQYYEYERVVRVEPSAAVTVEVPADPVTAIDEALAAYPAR
jgi:DNA repair exonuclease SbcCD ATPase subunit